MEAAEYDSTKCPTHVAVLTFEPHRTSNELRFVLFLFLALLICVPAVSLPVPVQTSVNESLETNRSEHLEYPSVHVESLATSQNTSNGIQTLKVSQTHKLKDPTLNKSTDSLKTISRIDSNSSAILRIEAKRRAYVQQLLLSLRDALRNLLVVHNSTMNVTDSLTSSPSPIYGTILGTMETIRSLKYNESNDSASTPTNMFRNSKLETTNSSLLNVPENSSTTENEWTITSGIGDAFRNLQTWIQKTTDKVRSNLSNGNKNSSVSGDVFEENELSKNSTEGSARMVVYNATMVVARVDTGILSGSNPLAVARRGAHIVVDVPEVDGIHKYYVKVEKLKEGEGNRSATVDVARVRLDTVQSGPNNTGFDIIIPFLGLGHWTMKNGSARIDRPWSAHTEEDDANFLRAQLECQRKFGASGLQRMLCTCESVHTFSLHRELLCVSRVADKAVRAAHHVGASSVGDDVYDGAVRCNEKTDLGLKLECLIEILEENVGRRTAFHSVHGRSILGHGDADAVDGVLARWVLTRGDVDGGSDVDEEVAVGFGPGGAGSWPVRAAMWTALSMVLLLCLACVFNIRRAALRSTRRASDTRGLFTTWARSLQYGRGSRRWRPVTRW